MKDLWVKPNVPLVICTLTTQRFRCVHLQDFFILQDAGETIAKGHGPKHQDVKQVHLRFSGNLDPKENSLSYFVVARERSNDAREQLFILVLNAFIC